VRVKTDVASCLFCGVETDRNVEVREGRTPAGMRDASADYAVGTCEGCQTLEPAVPGSAVRACLRLLGQDEAEWPAFLKALDGLDIDPTGVLYERSGSPRRGPQRKPYAHVPKDIRAELRTGWARVLAAKVAATLPPAAPTPEPPPDGAPGCLACGVGQALVWYGPLHTTGLTRGPTPVTGYVCPTCVEHLEAVGGVGERFIERACCAAQGVPWSDQTRVPGLRAWIATGRPPGEPWEWITVRPPAPDLDPFTELREQIAVLADRVAALEAGTAR
jgi:hypothetical protein